MFRKAHSIRICVLTGHFSLVFVAVLKSKVILILGVRSEDGYLNINSIKIGKKINQESN